MIYKKNFIKKKGVNMKTKEKDMINYSIKDQQVNTSSWFKDSPKGNKSYQKIKERKLFLYFSANSFFKNNHYVNNLVHGNKFSAQKFAPIFINLYLVILKI